MSTISDALKKVQTNRPDDTRGIVPPASGPSHPAAASSGSRLTAVVVAVLVLCLVMFLFITRAKNPSPPPSPARGEGVAPVPLSPPPSPTRGEGVAAAPESSPSPPVGEGLPAMPRIALQAGGGEGRVAVEPVAEKAPLPPPGPLPILSGTFYSTQNPVAIINGASLKEGETVGAYQVIKILPRSVTLKSSGGEIELRLQ